MQLVKTEITHARLIILILIKEIKKGLELTKPLLTKVVKNNLTDHSFSW